jgi:hypothetical protein
LADDTEFSRLGMFRASEVVCRGLVGRVLMALVVLVVGADAATELFNMC